MHPGVAGILFLRPCNAPRPISVLLAFILILHLMVDAFY